jgi:hypothetical protein
MMILFLIRDLQIHYFTSSPNQPANHYPLYHF